jgi:hypothetical protein
LNCIASLLGKSSRYNTYINHSYFKRYIKICLSVKKIMVTDERQQLLICNRSSIRYAGNRQGNNP